MGGTANRPGADGRSTVVTDRILLAHLVVCVPCRRAGPLHLVDDLVPPARLRAELLAAVAHRRWRPRPARRAPSRPHRR